MLHAISTECVGIHWHTIASGLLERMFWRKSVVQWRYCKNLELHLSMRLLLLLRFPVSSLGLRWHFSAWKWPYALCLISQQSPQGCPSNSASVGLVTVRLFLTFEDGQSDHYQLLRTDNQIIINLWGWTIRSLSTFEDGQSDHYQPLRMDSWQFPFSTRTFSWSVLWCPGPSLLRKLGVGESKPFCCFLCVCLLLEVVVGGGGWGGGCLKEGGERVRGDGRGC